MKKFLILVNDYPSEKNFYANGFVHRRVKLYESINNNKFDVFVLTEDSQNNSEYYFEGVKVTKGTKKNLTDSLALNKYSKILIHFINRHMIEVINGIKIPIVVWIHGSEALSWKRRLFNIKNEKKIEFFKYILKNKRQLSHLKKFVDNNEKVDLIFVSRWMKEIFEKDVKPRKNISKRSHIIANLIDDQLFTYHEKKEEQRFKFLSIRPHTSNKYANDITIGAIKILSNYSEFKNLEFTLIGDGPNFEKNTKDIKRFKNVTLNKTFLSQKEIAIQHKKFGILICPTRQDSQGVSMCEAMSSGLVPISTYNTAIPEFVEDGNTGLLIEKNSSKLLAEKILHIVENPEVFLRISKKTSKSIRDMCSSEVTINSELKIINQ